MVEVRILGVPGRGKPHNAAGYFDDFQVAAEAVLTWEKKKPIGIYFVFNECNPALRARSPNTITAYQNATTTDKDITRHRWMLVDCDPLRPSNISSTDDEMEASRMVAESICNWLAEQHFAEPIHAMSGNGYHLAYPINVPNDHDVAQLLEGILKTLDRKLSTDTVKVDTTVFNAARTTKLYGSTYARDTTRWIGPIDVAN